MGNASSHFQGDLPEIFESDYDEPEEGSGQNPEDVIHAQWHPSSDHSGDQSASPRENDNNPSSDGDSEEQEKPEEYDDREQRGDYREDEDHSDYYEEDEHYCDSNDEQEDRGTEEEQDDYNPAHQPAYIRYQEECWRRIEQSGAPLDTDGFFRPRTVYELHRYRHVLILQGRLSQSYELPPHLGTTHCRRGGNVPAWPQRTERRLRSRLVTFSCNGVIVARFRTRMEYGPV